MSSGDNKMRVRAVMQVPDDKGAIVTDRSDHRFFEWGEACLVDGLHYIKEVKECLRMVVRRIVDVGPV
jgi:hypothetical protein